MLVKSRYLHITVIVLITAVCIFIYYSDLIDYNWLRADTYVLSGDFTHEIYRLLFLIPMLYTAMVFNFRGAIIISVIVFFSEFPRALFISSNPDPLTRVIIFDLLAGAATVLLGLAHSRAHEEKKARRELQCLYNIAKIIERPGIKINELCQEVADLLRGNWPYPNIASVRITLGDKEFTTKSFKHTDWKISAALVGIAHETGTVEVHYLKKRPIISEKQYSDEDTLLINAIGERLGRAIGRMQTEETLRRQETILEGRAKELKQSQQRIVTIQESLRKEIAQELHGTVQGRLIVVLHELVEMEQKVTQKETNEELKNIHQIIGELQNNILRPVTQRLYPSILRRGLIPALQSLTDQFEPKLAVEMKLDEELALREKANSRLISEESRLAAYRIAEEAMINITKHSKADKVIFMVEQKSGGWFQLTVRDNGQGFDRNNSPHGLGLSIMQDYATILDGTCVISSTDKGTEVKATLPLSVPASEHSKTIVP